MKNCLHIHFISAAAHFFSFNQLAPLCEINKESDKWIGTHSEPTAQAYYNQAHANKQWKAQTINKYGRVSDATVLHMQGTLHSMSAMRKDVAPRSDAQISNQQSL